MAWVLLDPSQGPSDLVEFLLILSRRTQIRQNLVRFVSELQPKRWHGSVVRPVLGLVVVRVLSEIPEILDPASSAVSETACERSAQLLVLPNDQLPLGDADEGGQEYLALVIDGDGVAVVATDARLPEGDARPVISGELAKWS